MPPDEADCVPVTVSVVYVPSTCYNQSMTTPRLGDRQLSVIRLMDSNGGKLPLNHRWAQNQRVAATLVKHGLVEDGSLIATLTRKGLTDYDFMPEGPDIPEWQLTDDGRRAASRDRAGKPELCFTCDKRPAVYVKFSGAQGGDEIGYPNAHLLCQECFDEDREHWPNIPLRRCYRMTPVEAA